MRSTPMSSVDRTWLRMDSPDNQMVISALLTFRQPMSRERFRRLLEERFLRFERFRQRPARRGWRTVWEHCSELDWDYHLRCVSLPEVGSPEIALRRQVNDGLHRPLDPRHPLWRMELVEEYGRGSAVIVRIHHSYADGIALVGVIHSMADNGAELLETLPGQRSPARTTSVNRSESWAESLMALPGATGLRGLWHYLGRTSTFLVDAWRLIAMRRDPATRLKTPLGLEKRVAWAEPLPLARVKAIGRDLGCSLNDVLLGCVAGGLRRELERQGDTTEGLEVRAAVPYNMRPLHQFERLGNEFGLVYLPLPAGIADPAERVREVCRRMQTLKGSMQPAVSWFTLKLLGWLPGSLERVFLNYFSARASAVMTNVPGPQQPIVLDGCEIDTPLFWVPRSGDLGLGISIFSYDGQVHFGVVTDARQLPEPERLIEAFAAEFGELDRRFPQAESGEDRRLSA